MWSYKRSAHRAQINDRKIISVTLTARTVIDHFSSSICESVYPSVLPSVCLCVYVPDQCISSEHALRRPSTLWRWRAAMQTTPSNRICDPTSFNICLGSEITNGTFVENQNSENNDWIGYVRFLYRGSDRCRLICSGAIYSGGKLNWYSSLSNFQANYLTVTLSSTSVNIEQETQLSPTNRATRLEVSQGHQTWYHSICYVGFPITVL